MRVYSTLFFEACLLCTRYRGNNQEQLTEPTHFLTTNHPPEQRQQQLLFLFLLHPCSSSSGGGKEKAAQVHEPDHQGAGHAPGEVHGRRYTRKEGTVLRV